MEQKFKIIDRTIPEILKANSYTSKIGLVQFCRILKSLGADFIELDRNSVEVIKDLPEDIKFLFRMEVKEDLRIFDQYNFGGLLCSSIENLNYALEVLSERQSSINIILEITLDNIDRLDNWFFENRNIDFKRVYCIRIKGLSGNLQLLYSSDFSMLKELYKVKFDICAEDSYSCGTAISLEALEKGADFVTLSFCGKGGATEEGFGALEEVVMALKVLYKINLRVEPSFFSLAKRLYENLTKELIPGQKPILGEDIFKCESGIHVDGIFKNPELYEPYDPELVGLKREIILGKHSGSAAIIGRLSDLNLDVKGIDISSILDALREKSLDIKGKINDEELINILNSYLKGKE